MAVLLMLLGRAWALVGLATFALATQAELPAGWREVSLTVTGVVFGVPSVLMVMLGSSLAAPGAKRRWDDVPAVTGTVPSQRNR